MRSESQLWTVESHKFIRYIFKQRSVVVDLIIVDYYCMILGIYISIHILKKQHASVIYMFKIINCSNAWLHTKQQNNPDLMTTVTE